MSEAQGVCTAQAIWLLGIGDGTLHWVLGRDIPETRQRRWDTLGLGQGQLHVGGSKVKFRHSSSGFLKLGPVTASQISCLHFRHDLSLGWANRELHD